MIVLLYEIVNGKPVGTQNWDNVASKSMQRHGDVHGIR